MDTSNVRRYGEWIKAADFDALDAENKRMAEIVREILANEGMELPLPMIRALAKARAALEGV